MKSHRIILISRGECFTNTDESKFATEKRTSSVRRSRRKAEGTGSFFANKFSREQCPF